MRECKLLVASGNELEVGMKVLHGSFAEERKVKGMDTWSLGACIFLTIAEIKPVDPFNSLIYFEGEHQPSNINDDDEVLVAEIVTVPLGKGRMIGDV